MHTEDQSRNIRCCGPEGCGQLRLIENADPQTLYAFDSNNKPMARFCITGQCMAWRWHTWRMTANYVFPSTKEEPNDFADKLEKDGWKWVGIEGGIGCIAIWEKRAEHGYCGLAGRPG